MWEQNKDVQYVYSTHNSRQVWAIVSGVSGWKQVKTDSPDGVANIARILSAAKGHGRKVDIYLDGGNIARVLMR